MIKIKFFVCILINILLLTISIIGYQDILRKKEIVENQFPINVKVIDLTYRAKSQSTCELEYNNKIYKEVSLPQGIRINSVNNKDFYYDSVNDVVFCKEEKIGALYIVFGMFIFSFFLWFIPADKFK